MESGNTNFEYDPNSNIHILSSGSSEDESGITHHSYRYEVDPATGALLILEDGEGLDFPAPDLDDSLDDTLNRCSDNNNQATLEVLDSGEIVLVTSLKESEQNKAVKGNNSGSKSLKTGNASQGKDVSNKALVDASHAKRAIELPTKAGGSFWSHEKVEDLLQCIQKYARYLRKGTTTKMKVWKDISHAMKERGHDQCNKDECAKKWSNLLRTWKTIRAKSHLKRPAYFRRQWRFHDKVSHLVHLLAPKDDDLEKNSKSSPKQTKSRKSHDLLLKFMEQAKVQQEAMEKAEADFQRKVIRLDEEGDELLEDIKKIIEEKTKGNDHSHPTHLRTASISSSSVMTKLNLIGRNVTTEDQNNLRGNVVYVELPEGASADDIVSILSALNAGSDTNRPK